jgi:hypothetical protein
MVIFVDGNLDIQGTGTTITVPSGAFLAFIVSGNITIDPSVGTSDITQTTNGQVQGVYLADGTFTVDSAGVDLKFIGEGTFSACTGVSLPRDFNNGGSGVDNNKYPATEFIYRPDFMTNTPVKMQKPIYQWQEVAP